MPDNNIQLSRRSFISASASAMTMGPMILTGCKTSHAMNSSRSVAAKKDKHGAILIGAGKRTGILFKQFLNHPELELRIIAEVDTVRRNHYVALANQHYGNDTCVGVNDYREVLARGDIDTALIFTPDHWHTIPAMQAMLMGKHVYAEKPLTLNLLESQKIIEAQQKHNVTFQTGSQQRNEFGGRFIKAVEYVINGRLGKCELAECGAGDPAIPCALPAQETPNGLDWDLWQGPAPARAFHSDLCPRGIRYGWAQYRPYEEYAGGNLGDFGAHMFDIAQWAFDKDRESPAIITPPQDEKAKRGVQMTYADGKTIVHAPGPYGVKFIGEKGSIWVNRRELRSEPASILEEPLNDSDTRLHQSQNHFNNFMDCLGTDQQPVCDVHVGSRTAALGHLANICYDLQEELKFDGKSWRFSNSEKANSKLDYAERRRGFELPTVE